MEEVDDRVCCSNTRQTYLTIHWATLSKANSVAINPNDVPTLFTTISNFLLRSTQINSKVNSFRIL